MSRIGGNTTIMIQKQVGTEKNKIGETVPKWADAQEIFGWLDTMGGGTSYAAYNAKILESTDVFLADYVPLKEGVTAEGCRAIHGGKVYDVTYIDDPMGMHKHLEIFLKYTGGQ